MAKLNSKRLPKWIAAVSLAITLTAAAQVSPARTQMARRHSPTARRNLRRWTHPPQHPTRGTRPSCRAEKILIPKSVASQQPSSPPPTITLPSNIWSRHFRTNEILRFRSTSPGQRHGSAPTSLSSNSKISAAMSTSLPPRVSTQRVTSPTSSCPIASPQSARSLATIRIQPSAY